MKMRIIKLTPKFIEEAVSGKAYKFVSNLPSDFELLDIKMDLYSNQIIAVIRSESFEDVAELFSLPEMKVDYAERKQAASQSVSIKVEPKQEAPSKIENKPPKKSPIQSIAKTTNLEDEFSPEQRKLLSFKVEGEYVIVKPTQFLKEEWEDINEVVRSLGGRWVKGDIISFWQISMQQS
jgi:hypothetical protein